MLLAEGDERERDDDLEQREGHERGRLRARRPRSAPMRQAIGSSSAAASATRTKLRKTGETSSTATLMKRYGIPHTTETAAKVSQPFLVI